MTLDGLHDQNKQLIKKMKCSFCLCMRAPSHVECRKEFAWKRQEWPTRLLCWKTPSCQGLHTCPLYLRGSGAFGSLFKKLVFPTLLKDFRLWENPATYLFCFCHKLVYWRMYCAQVFTAEFVHSLRYIVYCSERPSQTFLVGLKSELVLPRYYLHGKLCVP